VNPSSLHPVSDQHRGWALRWFLDELKNTDLHVINSIVARHGEMFTNLLRLDSFVHIIEVVHKPVLDPQGSLSYILHATSFTRDSINQIGAPAGDILHARETGSCVTTANGATGVEFGAIPT